MEFLTRKVGPLPAWAWALIAGAVAWYIIRKRKSTAPAAVDSGLAPSDNAAGQAGELPFNPAPGYASSGLGDGLASSDIDPVLPPVRIFLNLPPAARSQPAPVHHKAPASHPTAPHLTTRRTRVARKPHVPPKPINRKLRRTLPRPTIGQLAQHPGAII